MTKPFEYDKILTLHEFYYEWDDKHKFINKALEQIRSQLYKQVDDYAEIILTYGITDGGEPCIMVFDEKKEFK